MRPRWNRLIVAGLLVVALATWAIYGPAIRSFAERIFLVGPASSTSDNVVGLIAMGVLAASLISTLRLLLNPPRSSP